MSEKMTKTEKKAIAEALFFLVSVLGRECKARGDLTAYGIGARVLRRLAKAFPPDDERVAEKVLEELEAIEGRAGEERIKQQAGNYSRNN